MWLPVAWRVLFLTSFLRLSIARGVPLKMSTVVIFAVHLPKISSWGATSADALLDDDELAPLNLPPTHLRHRLRPRSIASHNAA